MTSYKDILDNEISFIELFRILKSYKKFILIVPVVISIIVWIMTLNMAPTWEATSLIEVAQVGKYAPVLREEILTESNEQNIVWIDSPETIITRITHPSFLDKILNNPSVDVPRSKNSISANRIKGTAIIKLEVKTVSEQSSKNLTLAVISELQKMQQEQLSTSANFISEKIKQNEADLIEINNEVGRSKSSSDLYVKSMLKEKRNLTAMNYILKEQLSDVNTHPSRIVGETFIASSSVRLKHLIIVIMAFIVGAFFAIAASLIHHTLKK